MENKKYSEFYISGGNFKQEKQIIIFIKNIDLIERY